MVKTVTEFRQVARYMFLADAMIGASNSVFHITNDDIEPVERFYSLRITTIAGLSNEMNMTASSEGMETAKTIGYDKSLRFKMALSPRFDSFRGKSLYSAQAEINGKTFLISTQSGNNRIFTGGATTSFAALASSSVVNIVDDNETRELALVVIVFHNELQFVFQTQGGV